jgi:hypothetical protein
MNFTAYQMLLRSLNQKEWAGHVAHLDEKRRVCRVWWGQLREKGHLEDVGVDWKTTPNRC